MKKVKTALYLQIMIVCFCISSSCKNESKQSDNISKANTRIWRDVPPFKLGDNSLTLEEYSSMLKTGSGLNIKRVVLTNSKLQTDSSIVIKVEPVPYTTLEKGDSVLIYVRD